MGASGKPRKSNEKSDDGRMMPGDLGPTQDKTRDPGTQIGGEKTGDAAAAVVAEEGEALQTERVHDLPQGRRVLAKTEGRLVRKARGPRPGKVDKVAGERLAEDGRYVPKRHRVKRPSMNEEEIGSAARAPVSDASVFDLEEGWLAAQRVRMGHTYRVR